jgi:hypothetical protein
MHQDILRFRGGRYLWYGVALLALSVILYLTQADAQPPSGGTWQGYVLGTVGALLIVWLNLLGVRKRRYGGQGALQAWVSAHVYLGIALLGVALLHSAFQVGWNIHSLTLLLMIIVIVSGIVGIYFYASLPRRLAENRQGRSRAELLSELTRIDESSRRFAAECSPPVELAIRSSIDRTTLGGGLLDQLLARDRSTFLGSEPGVDDIGAAKPLPNSGQKRILQDVADLAPRVKSDAETAALESLVSLLARRQQILWRIRRDIQLQGWLEIWLYVHVPVSIALLMALTVHIVVVFLYW